MAKKSKAGKQWGHTAGAAALSITPPSAIGVGGYAGYKYAKATHKNQGQHTVIGIMGAPISGPVYTHLTPKGHTIFDRKSTHRGIDRKR
jgi:hypothetical protein